MGLYNNMTANTDLEKIQKVLSKISGKELKEFVRTYALTHDDLATALVERYWKPERGNIREMVEACFAHTGVESGVYGMPSLAWRQIETDLAALMKKANSMVRKDNLIDAALIAGYVLTTTCKEFGQDHRNYTPARHDLWAEENKVLRGIVEQAEDMERKLLIESDGIEEDSRLGMLGEIAERCEEIGDNYLMRLTWFVDEAMPLLCGDDEKAYMAHISKRMKNNKDKFFHHRYIIQKADYWIAHGKKAKAERLLTDKRDDENVRDHYIDCLTEWKEYKKAVELIDDNEDSFKAMYKNWEDRLIDILRLSGDREWLIAECRKRCITGEYKLRYYKALKETVAKEEWTDFMTKLWDDIDWSKDYDDAEAKIAIQEKWYSRLLPFLKRNSYNIIELYPEYVKYIPKKDLKAVGEMISKDIERLAMLNEKPKEFAWLLERVESVMGHSGIVDGVIRDGIRGLIAENPEKAYIKNYLGDLLHQH